MSPHSLAPLAESDLTIISQDITKKISNLQSLLQTYAIPQPSLSLDLDTAPPPPLTLEQHAVITPARDALAQAARELYLLALGPQQWLHQQVLVDKFDSAVLRVILIHELDKAVPLPGEISFEELAAKAKPEALNPRTVKRLVKFAMAFGFFQENKPGFVSHSVLSAVWVRDDDSREWAMHNLRDVWPASLEFTEALVKYKGSEEPNETPRNIHHREDGNVFDFFAKDATRLGTFHGAMRATAQHPGFAVQPVAEWKGWSELPEGATVVDVGGSLGHVSAAVARKQKHLNFIVQDLPEVISRAAAEPDLKDRMSFQAHDFFEPQTESADVYLFRWVLHDWPDKYAVKILQNLIPKMKPNSKILIVDVLLPEANKVPKLQEKQARGFDLQMFAIVGSLERDRDMWNELVTKADSRLELKEPIQPKGCNYAFVEVVLRSG